MIIIISLIILFVLLMIAYTQIETFDKDMNEWLPLGRQRYGLRGEPLNMHAMNDCYFDKYKCYTNTSQIYYG